MRHFIEGAAVFFGLVTMSLMVFGWGVMVATIVQKVLG